MRDEDFPWELENIPRRDCEPHRGDLLLLMGNASLVCGLLSLCFVLPALLGFVFGISVLMMGQKDLTRMNTGLMDPQGKEKTFQASHRAAYGVTFCLCCWLPFIQYGFLQLALAFRP